MNGFLVMLQRAMDDVPLGLYATKGEASDAAKVASWDVPQELQLALGMQSVSSPNLISIITFVDGEPIHREVVRIYGNE